jgi:hypothetical protein
MKATAEKLNKVGWLIYIIAKKEIPESASFELSDLALMIAAILNILLENYSEDDVEIGLLRNKDRS